MKGEDEIMKTDSVGDKTKHMQIRIYFMDDLSERQKAKIKEAIKGIRNTWLSDLTRYGIMPASYPFLDNVVDVLKENPDIRLEISSACS